MSFTRINRFSNDFTNPTTITTISLTATYNQAAGDLVEVTASWESNAGVVTCTDVAGNTYTASSKVQAAGPSNKWVQKWYVLSSLASAVNNVTVNFTANVDYVHLDVSIYRPSGTASFIGEGTGSGNSTSQTTTSQTAGTLATYVMGEFTGTTATEGSGWTEQWDNPANASHGYDRIDSPGGSITGTSTTGAAVNYAALLMTYNDTGGGGGGAILMGQACL